MKFALVLSTVAFTKFTLWSTNQDGTFSIKSILAKLILRTPSLVNENDLFGNGIPSTVMTPPNLTYQVNLKDRLT